MTSYRLMVALVLVLVCTCLAEDRGGEDPIVSRQLVGHVFSRAGISGSLEYWGPCDPHKRSLDFPSVRILPNFAGPPREILQQMFSDDKKMRVTQEENGMVRMVEDDVPMDLLGVKIRHLSFNVSGPDADSWHGPHMALLAILWTPEVTAFKKAHNIGPFENGVMLPGDASDPGTPSISGELENVTVAQALDYVLKTFPGFWIYENCRGQAGGRTVSFSFVENFPISVFHDSVKKRP